MLRESGVGFIRAWVRCDHCVQTLEVQIPSAVLEKAQKRGLAEFIYEHAPDHSLFLLVDKNGSVRDCRTALKTVSEEREEFTSRKRPVMGIDKKCEKREVIELFLNLKGQKPSGAGCILFIQDRKIVSQLCATLPSSTLLNEIVENIPGKNDVTRFSKLANEIVIARDLFIFNVGKTSVVIVLENSKKEVDKDCVRFKDGVESLMALVEGASPDVFVMGILIFFYPQSVTARVVNVKKILRNSKALIEEFGERLALSYLNLPKTVLKFYFDLKRWHSLSDICRYFLKLYSQGAMKLEYGRG